MHYYAHPDYLHGVKVIDHTSFVYNGIARNFKWREYGFKTHAMFQTMLFPLEQRNMKLTSKPLFLGSSSYQMAWSSSVVYTGY